jgi:hypothetical protein
MPHGIAGCARGGYREIEPKAPACRVIRDGVVETQRIVTGLRSDTDIEIRGGLKEGDTLVANAGSSLHAGNLVKPTYLKRSEE